jgi:hypothetical protein
MDAIQTLMFLAIIVCVSVLIISIPSLIAKNRGLSEDHRKTVLLLAILGLFFGVTWLVALILAYVYPPAPQRISRRFSRPKNSDRVRQSAMNDADDDLDEFFGVPERENCQNCDGLSANLKHRRYGTTISSMLHATKHCRSKRIYDLRERSSV